MGRHDYVSVYGLVSLLVMFLMADHTGPLLLARAATTAGLALAQHGQEGRDSQPGRAGPRRRLACSGRYWPTWTHERGQLQQRRYLGAKAKIDWYIKQTAREDGAVKERPPYQQEQVLEQLEIVAVQLDECRRLIEQGRAAQLRVALLLIDNAAELIMRRQIVQATEYNHLWKKYPESLDLPEDDKARVAIHNMAGNYVDDKRLYEIEKHFPKKVAFLVERGIIDRALGDSLNKLHDYRNEAQHRDTVRVATIGPAVRIYFDMTCTLLAGYKPHVWIYRALTPPGEPEIDWFSENYPTTAALLGGKQRPGTNEEAVAKALRRSVDIDSLDALRQALNDHLMSRVDEIEKELEFARRIWMHLTQMRLKRQRCLNPRERTIRLDQAETASIGV